MFEILEQLLDCLSGLALLLLGTLLMLPNQHLLLLLLSNDLQLLLSVFL
jgi:hypothetical protein